MKKKEYFPSSCAANVDDIFWHFGFDDFKTPKYKTQAEANKNRKRRVFPRMFFDCFYLAIEDVIENNATFILPTSRRKAYLSMNYLNKKDFMKARQNGHCMNIDFLASNYKMYYPEVVIESKRTGAMNGYQITPPKSLVDKIVKLTNKGKRFY